MADDTPAEPQASRHQRFRAVMEAAAGPARADYNGQGPFWNLPLPELRGFTLFGLPMMRGAPAGPPLGTAPQSPAPSCCHDDRASRPSAFPPSTPAPGAADDSGLVRGLRGLYPFDGTQYPRLPWGGRAVAAHDIAFVAAWIADGCPGAEEEATPPPAGALPVTDDRRALATGQAAHAAFGGPTNQLADDAGGIKFRKNVAFLTPEELGRYRAALARMKSLDAFPQDERSFAYWARIHANQCQHGWEEFLTWHRAYLYGFEKQLQDIDPSVTLPYWDWAADVDDVRISIEDMASGASLDNGVVPAAFQCWLDDAGLQRLVAGGEVPEGAIDGLRTILGRSFSSGSRLYVAASLTYGTDTARDTAIIAELESINPMWTWRRWPGGNKTLIFEAYPTPGDIEAMLTIENFFTFGSGPSADRSFGTLENIHNLIHNFSGGANPSPPTPENPFATGDMVDPGRTAFDPIFWSHHANVDRLWAEWQRRFPGGRPDNPDAILPPFDFTVADTASTRALGYAYAMTTHVFPTDGTQALHRFRSAEAAIHEGVLTTHKRAEVRLHAIRQVTRPGYYLRIFLNVPRPTLDMPTRGNPHYVGQVSMFTGLCVGGPGHCATPTPPTDRFDRRHSHHKTPSSFRLDATAAVRALAAAGATRFAVTVVSFNIDGSPAEDALKLAAVSLDFFD